MSPAPKRPKRNLDPRSDTYVAQARLGFLQTVESVAPEVGKDLYDNVQPPFNSLADQMERTGAHNAHRTIQYLRAATERRAKAEAANHSDARTRILELTNLQRAVLGALEEWATKYNLHRDQWILEAALLHLWRSRQRGERIKLGYTGPSTSYSLPATELEPPRYRPDLMTAAQFHDEVETYIAAVEAAYGAAGWAETPDSPHGQAHMEWLVRFQVNGEKVKDLAASVGVADRNLQEALRSKAELIGLTRRTMPVQPNKDRPHVP